MRWSGYSQFQSPRNRVKCSDTEQMIDLTKVSRFQSPRNRVKCSDREEFKSLMLEEMSFNPLEIGSNVLIEEGTEGSEEEAKFQSPRNRVKCSDKKDLVLLASQYKVSIP